MTLKQKALEMRTALDGIELALMGVGDWTALRTLWRDARNDLNIKVEMPVASLRQLCDALDECNRIVNEPEYSPERFR